MGRRRVRPEMEQGELPGFGAVARGRKAERVRGVDAAMGVDWEDVAFQDGCAHGRSLAVARLAALEETLHESRMATLAVEGWRTRTVVTRLGAIRLRRRLYRDVGGGGGSIFLLDAHLGWTPKQTATPAFRALLVDWAADVPVDEAARRLGAATAGVLSGPTVLRQVRAVAGRARAAEAATHAAWTGAAMLPADDGARVVPALYVEADGVWVKTQREVDHRRGFELKCASAYEGWEQQATPTPGHPRARYRLVEKQVYCHGHDQAALPFWEGASLALGHTYDLSALPLVVVAGDGANWIDTGRTVFARAVRQRDSFHLARDAARGWGPEQGAELIRAVRAGDAATVRALMPRSPVWPALPAPTGIDASSGVSPQSVSAPPTPPGRRSPWSARQTARARRAVADAVGRPDAGADWRTQVAPGEVPAGARALGTQEGTNAHLLARRMKHRGCSWTVSGARAMAKVRELVTNSTLAPWCVVRPAPAPCPHAPSSPPPCDPADTVVRSALPWPHAPCPALGSSFNDPVVAHLHRLLNASYRLS